MDKNMKKLITAFVIVVFITIAAYIGYQVYNYAVEQATARIKKGVEEGISQGIGDTINPLTWPGKIFGPKG